MTKDELDLENMIAHINEDGGDLIRREKLEAWYNRHGLQYKVTSHSVCASKNSNLRRGLGFRNSGSPVGFGVKE